MAVEAQGQPENSWHIHPSIDDIANPSTSSRAVVDMWTAVQMSCLLARDRRLVRGVSLGRSRRLPAHGAYSS